MSGRLRRPGRGPGTVNLGVAVASLAVLLPLLLQASTSAPPTAAEFSPNADKVIKKAPDGQGAVSNGTGEGEGGPGASPAPTTPPPVPTSGKTINPPATQVKRCVGPPPERQIEDPQSPPCIKYWQGDNGGATAKGVTRESVYVVVATPESTRRQWDAMFQFFNERFQFYGRKMVPIYCDEGNAGASDQATQVADAAEAASGCGGQFPKPFASTFYRSNNGAYYMPAMACTHKVIVVGVYSPYDSVFMNRCKDYQYQYPMEVDEQFANVGEWVCNRLAGRVAKHGGATTLGTAPLNEQKRKFGVLLEPFTDDDPVARPEALEPILKRLKACGAEVEPGNAIVNPVPTNNFEPSSAQNTMLQLRQDGVTSVICMCNFFSYGTLARAADGANYQPEWITGSFGLNDVNSSFVLSAATNTQLQHTFGLTFNPRMVPPLTNPYNMAVSEYDSSLQDTTTTGQARLEQYRSLLLIASGIQMAGPRLTVQTFRDGLRKTRFPNPFTELMAGDVDVKPGGWSMTADAAEWWYSTTDPGPFTDSNAKRGTVCYLNGGRRYRLGGWPTGEAPFFGVRCDSGA